MSKWLFSPLRISICLLWASVGSALFSQHSEFAIIGDGGAITQASAMVRQSIHRANVQQLILPGDNLYDHKKTTYEKVWEPWTSLGMRFSMVAIGNHRDNYTKEMKFFSMPEEFYTYKIGTARFIVLNSDNEDRAMEQAEFLDKKLQETRSSYVFLIYHHPSYTVSTFHEWTEKKKFQLAIRPIIWKYRHKITAILVGHDHLASLIHFNDLPVILSGAVQEVRTDKMVAYTDTIDSHNGVVVQSSWYFDHEPYWAKLSVPDENARKDSPAFVQFIRAQDSYIACTAQLRTGQAAQLGPNCATRPPSLQ